MTARNSGDDGLGTWLILGLIGWGLYSCSTESDSERLVDEYGISEEVADQYLEEADGDFDTAAYNYDINADSIEYGGYEEEVEREEFDEHEARREAENEMAVSGYDYSYGCTIDCSGHEAGWDYRAGTGYETGIDQYGKSQPFDEGARAYEEAVDNRVEEMRDEYESGEEPY